MLEVEYDREHINYWRSLPFLSVHVGAVVGVVLVGWSPLLLALAAASYLVRMWAITVGYHRYFSHRTFKTGRFFQLALAFLGALSLQKGALWWAAHHREHHRHSDQEEDIHSPTVKSFFWAHVGWILSYKYDETRFDKIRDFACYPELRWLNKYHSVPGIAVGALIWLTAGFDVFVWVGLVATVALWHGTFTINSLCHVFGRRRYPTRDHSKNSLVLALITLGEGWHNNHHYYPGSSRQGFYWWEVDVSYYTLKALEWLGVVWDVRGVPDRVLEKGREPLPEAEPAPSPAAS